MEQFTEEEIKFLLKIQEESLFNETDLILKKILVENIKNLKDNIFNDDAFEWFDSYFYDNPQPEDLADSPHDIEIAKNILLKFGKNIKNIVKCPNCSSFINLFELKLMKVSNGKSAIRGTCSKCGNRIFKLTAERYPKSFYSKD